MSKEDYIEEGINGQWTDWKFEAENNKRIYEELQKRINKAIEIINNTVVIKSNEDFIELIYKIHEILKGDVK